ncbi:hypothetical protein KCP69_25100 [Salmonella enterica subsp. enterica]|nr:hypothetical protein KCP69_25100 [Salmonella enterica subsp. enterica]
MIGATVFVNSRLKPVLSIASAALTISTSATYTSLIAWQVSCLASLLMAYAGDERLYTGGNTVRRSASGKSIFFQRRPPQYQLGLHQAFRGLIRRWRKD